MEINKIIKKFKIKLKTSNFSIQTIRAYGNILDIFSNCIKDVLSVT